MTQPIYYMRDNHTFKKLSDDVSTAMVEIEHEFNDGYTYGMLCSKRDGFPTVHAAGSKNRLTFFADCKAVLEQWLPAAPPQRTEQEPVQEPKNYRHTWGKDGEGCVICGDKDWMNTSCKPLAPQRTEQEPVKLPCCGYTDASAVKWNPFNRVVQCHNCGQTYTQPQRKPLTDEQIVAINDKHYNIAYRDFDADIAIARAIEAAHGIKGDA